MIKFKKKKNKSFTILYKTQNTSLINDKNEKFTFFFINQNVIKIYEKNN